MTTRQHAETTGFGRWQIAGALILSASLLTAGAGMVRHVAVVPPETAPKDPPATPVEIRKDRHGDPLPPGALARLGTVRQRAPGSHLAVTADGKEVVAVGGDLTLRRFDARTGALRSVRQLPMASGKLWFRTWLSPRGTFMLAAGPSGLRNYHLDLWDLAEAKIRQTLPLTGHSGLGAAFSMDERRVAVTDSSGDKTHRVLVWDLQTSASRVIWSEKKDINSFYFEPVVAFSPDGKRLIACHYDQILRCWDVESGKLLWQSEKKIWSPFLFFSSDGRTVVTMANIGIAGIHLYDAATGKLLEGKKPPPKEAVYPIGFSPDGRFMAFQTGLEEVVLWEPGKEEVAFRFPRPPHRRDDGHFVPNQLPTNFAFTPDSKAFIRRAGSLQRWNLSSGKPIYEDTENWGHTEEATRIIFSPDGRLLASSSKDQTARLWEIATARTLHVIPKGLSGHLAFTPDGRKLFTVPSGLGKVVLQSTDVVTGRPGRGFELADRREFTAGSRDKEIRVTTNGKKILMLTQKNIRRSDESILTIWDTASGECLDHKRVPWQERSLLTPDGRGVLAVDSATQAVRLLALETAQPRWQLNSERMNTPLHVTYDWNLALSPDGRLLATRICFLNLPTSQVEYGAIHLGDMATGRQLHKLSINGPAVFAFSADSRLFAVADPARIRLWETASWQEIGSFRIANDKNKPADCTCARSLAFSPDGRILATGHRDGTILLWDASLRHGTRGGPLRAAERAALWSDLAETDAAKAYAAVWRFADDGAASVPFLKQRLRPVPPLPPQMVRTLLDELDSDQFSVREAAERKLRELGERAISPLREALKAKPSLEMRRRVERVLAALEVTGPLSGEPLRAVRAVQALERIGSAESRQLLGELSQGVASAKLTQAAKESLTRLKKR